MTFFEENFIVILISAFVIFNGIIVATLIFYRMRKKANLAPFDDTSLEFDESWVSGFSKKSLYTRMGRASKCLTVSVNSKEVFIRPFFPFTFFFLPEIFDLEHRIPNDRILLVNLTNDLLGKETVTVTFKDSENKERSFVLYLNNQSEFISLFQNRTSAA